MQHPLKQRVADAVNNAAPDLSVDEHRIDQPPAVMGDDVAPDVHVRPFRYRPRPRRLACRWQRPSGGLRNSAVCRQIPARRPGGSGTPAAPDKPGASRQASRSSPARRATCTSPSSQTRSSSAASSICAATLIAFARGPPSRRYRRTSPPVTAIRLANRADPSGNAPVSAASTTDIAMATPRRSAAICASTVACPCPWLRGAGLDCDFAGRRDAHGRAFERSEPGVLDA